MRHLFALAAAAAIAVMPGLALADDPGDIDPLDAGVGPSLGTDTVFDLGIDVNAIPTTPAAVKAFLSGLAPGTQSILLTTCAHYMATPDAVESRETLEFCRNVTRG